VQDSWVPVYESGKLVSTEGLLSDITTAKLAENKLRESEAQLKEAQRLAKLGSWNWDVVTDTITWSDELYALWGLDKEPVPPSLALYMKHFMPPTLSPPSSTLKQASPTGEDYQFETEFQRADKTSGYLLIHGTSQRDNNGRIIRLYGTAQDITERKRLEQQLLDISEREQRRIGQDLHDGVGQQLTALRFLSSTLRQKLGEHEFSAAKDFDRLDALLANAIKDVRGLARGLHPVHTDGLGLMHSLRELCRSMQSVFGVPCTFDCADPVLIHDPAAAVNLYRIAQEATRNAAAHGAPKQIQIHLSQQDSLLRLVIKDDGHGLPRARRKQGMGLEIMRYRAHAIGATLAVASEPEAGVTITCEWPCQPAKERT